MKWFQSKTTKTDNVHSKIFKNTQDYCQPTKESICYNRRLHTQYEAQFRHPQILKLASGTYTEWILNRDKNQKEIYQKIPKKLLQRQNINSQIHYRFTLATNLKIGLYVLIPNYTTQKRIPKKLQPLGTTSDTFSSFFLLLQTYVNLPKIFDHLLWYDTSNTYVNVPTSIQ